MDVDDIFARFAVLYGTKFTKQWPDSALPHVKAVWKEELSIFDSQPGAIEYGLENLPADHAPMILEFRDICRNFNPNRQAPARLKPQTQEERAHALAVLAGFARPAPRDPRAWARALRARELAGERLTKFQRECWRDALGASDSPAES